MAFKVDKFEFVELVIPGVAGGQTGTRFNFPDLPKLRYVSTQGLQCFTNDNTVGTSPSNYANLAASVTLENAFLSLYCNERQDIWRVPLNVLNNMNGSHVNWNIWEMKGQQIVWDKSYVEFGVAPANTTTAAIFFGVYYA